MRKVNLYLILFLVVFVMSGCLDYDDTELRTDIKSVKQRLEKLESWCETTNTQISALQGLIDTLEKNDYVTGVTPIMV